MIRRGILVGAVLLAGLIPEQASAQPPSAQPTSLELPSDSLPNIRGMPHREISRRLSADWLAVERMELRRLLDRAAANLQQPPEVQITTAHYHATVTGTSLTDGRLTARIHRSVDEPRLLTLSTRNLAIWDLRWKRSPAVWGSTPDGRTVLHVDRTFGELEGSWQSQGRQRRASTEFTLQFPAADVTQLTLLVPGDQQLTSDTGTTSCLSPRDAPIRRWQIDLGQASSCRLSLRPARGLEVRPARILAGFSNRYLIRDDGTRIQYDLELEVLNAPLSEIDLKLPADVTLFAAVFGSDVQLRYELLERTEHDQTLRLHLPDPTEGTLRRIRLECFSPTQLGEPWTLGTVTIPGAIFLRGQSQLEISRPLQLQGFDAQGILQTRAVMDGASHELLTYQHLIPTGQLAVHVDYPETRLRVTSLTHLDLLKPNWSFQTEMNWIADSGYQFQCRAIIAEGWRITDVQVADSDLRTQIVSWDLQPRPDRSSLLTVEFAVALSDNEPRSIVISGQRKPAVSRRELAIPAVEPLDALEVDSTVAISASPELIRADSINTWEFEQVNLSDVPDSVRNSQLWNPLIASDSVPLVLQTNSRHATQSIAINAEPTAVFASPVVSARIDRDVIHEEFRLRLRPVDTAIERFRVYVSQRGPRLDWEVAGGVPVALTARRLPAPEWSHLNLPETGELWELAFEPGLKRSVEITASRQRPRQATDRIALLMTPETEQLSGDVQVQLTEQLQLELQPENLKRRMLIGEGRRWTYTSMDARLIVREQQTTPSERRATLQLRSQIQALADAPSVFWASFQLHDSEDDLFEFSLPAGAQLIAVRTNETLSAVTTGDDLFRVRPTPAGSRNEIEIQYRMPGQSLHLEGSVPVAVPATNVDVVGFEWQLALPAEMSLIGCPTGLLVASAPHHLTFRRRLFGPLGRLGREPVFDPTDGGNWWDQFRTELQDNDAGQTVTWKLGAQRWHVWQLVGAAPPNQLEIRLVNDAVVREIAWIAFWLILSLSLGWRIRDWNRGRTAALTLLGLLLMTAMLLPDEFAPIAGGGLSGLCLAYIVPLKQMRRKRNGLIDRLNPLSTTVQYPATTGALLLMAACGLAVPLCAQPSESDEAPLSPNELIEPRDEQDRPLGTLLYLHRKNLQALQLSAEPPGAYVEYLLGRADYELELTGLSPVVHVKLDVTVLTDQSEVSVVLPFDGVSLGGPDACRVDGVPHPVRLAANGRGFIVTLTQHIEERSLTPRQLTADRASRQGTVPAARDYRIPYREPQHFQVELDLFPPSQPVSGIRDITLELPQVADSRLICKSLLETIYPVLIDGSHERPLSISTDTAEPQAVHLGNVDQLQVRWSDQPQTLLPSARWQASTESVVEVQPNWSQWTTRINLTPVSGTLHDLIIDLPAEADKLRIDGADILSVDVVDNDAVVVEFQTPQAGPLTLNASFLVPHAPQDGRVTIPGWHPFDASTRIQLTDARQGMFTGPNQILEEVAFDTQTTSRLIEELAISSRRSQFAYQLSAVSSFDYRIDTRHPRRTVSQNLEARVDSNGIHWQLSAELQTTETAAFQHRMQVEEAVEIETVSVLEDGAERLVRWNRLGSELTLFLSGRTKGLQNIRIRAHLDARPAVPIQLPRMVFENAEVVESYLSVYQAPDVTIQLAAIGSEQLTTVSDNGTESTDSGRVGRFNLTGQDSLPTVTIRKRRVSYPVNALTTVIATESPDIQYTTRLELPPSSSRTRNLQLNVLGPHVDQLQLRWNDQDIPATSEEDSSRTWLIGPLPNDREPLSVTLTGTLPVDTDKRLRLPRIVISGTPEVESYLICGYPAEQEIQLNGAEPVSRSLLPAFVQQSSLAVIPAAQQQAFRLSAIDAAVELAWQKRDGAEDDNRISVVEHTVWLNADGQTNGRTRAYLRMTARSGRLTATWPESIEVTAILLNRQTPRRDLDQQHAAGSYSVQLDSETNDVIEIVDLRWKLRESREFELNQDLIPLPRFETPTPPLTQLALHCDPRCDLYAAGGILKEDEWDLLLKKTQHFIALCEQHLEYSSTTPLAWGPLTRTRVRLQQLLSSTTSNNREIEQRRSQLTGIDQQLKDLSTRLNTSGMTNVAHLPAPTRSPLLREPQRLLGEPLETPGQNESAVQVWVVPRVVKRWLIALGVIPLATWLVLRLAQWPIFLRMLGNGGLRTMMLGALWWLCLSPSPIGLILLGWGIVRLTYVPQHVEAASQPASTAAQPAT